jgi:hypothetical protein
MLLLNLYAGLGKCIRLISLFVFIFDRLWLTNEINMEFQGTQNLHRKLQTATQISADH